LVHRINININTVYQQQLFVLIFEKMKPTLLLLVFVVFGAVASVSAGRGLWLVANRTGTDIVTIVGGNTAKEGLYPFIVSLRTGTGNSHFCGGTIIREDFILTAAHCVEGATPADVRVGAGDNTRSRQTIHTVSAVYVHPQFDYYNIDYDVAVLKLSAPLELSTKIQLKDLAPIEPEDGAIVNVAGWGTTSSGGGTLPTALREVTVSIVPRQTCEDNYGPDAITARMICAADLGKDSCQGDSGGPLVYSDAEATKLGSLVGIVSWGYGCAEPEYPGVYTSVPDLYKWIVEQLS